MLRVLCMLCMLCYVMLGYVRLCYVSMYECMTVRMCPSLVEGSITGMLDGFRLQGSVHGAGLFGCGVDRGNT